MSISTDLNYWTEVAEGTFQDHQNATCEERRPYELAFKPQLARYVRFEATSYYGAGGGLQYFDIKEATACDLKEAKEEEERSV